ncbi:cytochrome P450 [Xylariomycetidae sp. FL2044]|nr:cytochrome P450 [Xylariomycetidae sp. FL2044]
MARDMQSLPTWLLLTAIGCFLAGPAILRFVTLIITTWRHRTHMRKLQKLGHPMHAHNPIMGHMLAAKAAAEELPPGAHSGYILSRLAKKLGGADAYYFDSFPIAVPLLVTTDSYLANQLIDHSWSSARKPPELSSWFQPITGRGGVNLFTENGQEWKHNNNLFLPFFSSSNLDAAIPVVLQQMLVFRDYLRQKAQSGERFCLEPLTLNLMNDVIGQILFNAELGNQTSSGSHPLSQTMLRQLSLKFASNNVMENLGQLNPFRVFSMWNNGRLLDKEIRRQIEIRADVFRRAKAQGGEVDSGFVAILDQALRTYYAQPGRKYSDPLSAKFMEILCAELRMFFFAGYDSTSSVMCSTVYLLYKHPEALARLRAEHDEVFGRNVAACADMIAENPAILNALPYTQAVVKEAMRLFPPANTIRTGCRDLVLRGRDGTEYPTEGVLVQANHISIHRNPKSWVRPLEYLPERFIVGPGHELCPPKGAWRPFEFGPRKCTGQAFVMKEMRVYLALLAREFDFTDCYDEVYAGEKVDLTNVDGEKAYLVEAGSAHLRGQTPMTCRTACP